MITQTIFPSGDKHILIQKIINRGNYYTIIEDIKSSKCSKTTMEEEKTGLDSKNVKIHIQRLNGQILLKADVSNKINTIPAYLKPLIDKKGLMTIFKSEIPSQETVNRINKIAEGC